MERDLDNVVGVLSIETELFSQVNKLIERMSDENRVFAFLLSVNHQLLAPLLSYLKIAEDIIALPPYTAVAHAPSNSYPASSAASSSAQYQHSAILHLIVVCKPECSPSALTSLGTFPLRFPNLLVLAEVFQPAFWGGGGGGTHLERRFGGGF